MDVDNMSWENLVEECEGVLELEGHAESPLMSNLPNVLRGLKETAQRSNIVVEKLHSNQQTLDAILLDDVINIIRVQTHGIYSSKFDIGELRKNMIAAITKHAKQQQL